MPDLPARFALVAVGESAASSCPAVWPLASFFVRAISASEAQQSCESSLCQEFCKDRDGEPVKVNEQKQHGGKYVADGICSDERGGVRSRGFGMEW